MPTGTVKLHRVLRAPPERVYRAYLDADAMAKWLPPNGFTGKVHQMDAKVGGTYKMSFTNFSTGQSDSFGGKYLELIPNERIRHTDRFDDPNLPGEMQTTVSISGRCRRNRVEYRAGRNPRSPSRRRPAISAGRSRSRCLRSSSKRRFRDDRSTLLRRMTESGNTLKRPKNPMPGFVRDALNERGLMEAYRARPPYQQNDYLGWIARRQTGGYEAEAAQPDARRIGGREALHEHGLEAARVRARRFVSRMILRCADAVRAAVLHNRQRIPP